MKSIVVQLFLLFISNSIIAQWVETDCNYNIDDSFTSFIVTDSTIYTATTHDGLHADGSGVFFSKDNGVSWNTINSGLTDGYVFSMGKIGNTLLAGTSNGIYLLNINDTNWFLPESGVPSVIWSFAANDSNIFSGTIYNGIYLSQDFGENWIEKNAGLPVNATIRSIAIDDSVVVAGTDDGVYISYDLGNNWNYKSNGIPAGTSIRSLSIYNNVIYAGTNLEGIFRSDDYGENWLAKNNGLNQYCNVFSIIHTDSIIYIATLDEGVYYSMNNGENWQEKNNGLLPNIINSIACTNNILFAGTDYHGVWKLNLLQNSIKEELKNNYFNVYTNNNNELIIENKETVKFEAYLINISGQILYESFNNINDLIIDINYFNSEIYFLKIISDKSSIVYKVYKN